MITSGPLQLYPSIGRYTLRPLVGEAAGVSGEQRVGRAPDRVSNQQEAQQAGYARATINADAVVALRVEQLNHDWDDQTEALSD